MSHVPICIHCVQKTNCAERCPSRDPQGWDRPEAIQGTRSGRLCTRPPHHTSRHPRGRMWRRLEAPKNLETRGSHVLATHPAGKLEKRDEAERRTPQGVNYEAVKLHTSHKTAFPAAHDLRASMPRERTLLENTRPVTTYSAKSSSSQDPKPKPDLARRMPRPYLCPPRGVCCGCPAQKLGAL